MPVSLLISSVLLILSAPGSASIAPQDVTGRPVGQPAAAGLGSHTQRSRTCVGPICLGLGRSSQSNARGPAAGPPPGPTDPAATDSYHQGVGDEAGCIRGGHAGGGGGGTVVFPSGGGGSSGGGGGLNTPTPSGGCPNPAPTPTPFR